jgi:hypothetical protein
MQRNTVVAVIVILLLLVTILLVWFFYRLSHVAKREARHPYTNSGTSSASTEVSVISVHILHNNQPPPPPAFGGRGGMGGMRPPGRAGF